MALVRSQSTDVASHLSQGDDQQLKKLEEVSVRAASCSGELPSRMLFNFRSRPCIKTPRTWTHSRFNGRRSDDFFELLPSIIYP